MKAQMVFGAVTVEAEGDTKQVFAELASAAEIFGQSTCGACGSEKVAPVAREVDSNHYYEMRCSSCGCSLSFGQTKATQSLFPRRKKNEAWLPNRGWVEAFNANRPREDNKQAEPDSFTGF